MITIVDYGLGNVLAFSNVFKRLNIEVTAARTAEDLGTATKIILPGVGAFDHAMERLQRSGMREALDAKVLEQGVPVIGICVGMQMLADSSDEGQLPGLGWIKGKVRGFKNTDASRDLPLPHMGWNDVQPVTDQELFQGLETDSRFYFLHSFFFECQDPADTAARSTYGLDFSSAVKHNNIYGVQFHPEKSHHYGTRLLKNFAGL
jgi:glutamine amidotransferase